MRVFKDLAGATIVVAIVVACSAVARSPIAQVQPEPMSTPVAPVMIAARGPADSADEPRRPRVMTTKDLLAFEDDWSLRVGSARAGLFAASCNLESWDVANANEFRTLTALQHDWRWDRFSDVQREAVNQWINYIQKQVRATIGPCPKPYG